MYYLEIIKDCVVYAEDNIFRLMVFDGLVGYYYEKETTYYEYGSGVSTSKSDVWTERLIKDWNATNDLMHRRVRNNDLFQMKICKYIIYEKNIKMFLFRPYKHKWLNMKLYRKFHKRYVSLMIEG